MTTKARLGNQHPTQSVILPYDKSLYQEAVDYYQRTGRKCYEWQVNMLKAIMAIDDDGLWVHQKFGFSIPRRNGKTEIVYDLEIWALENGLNVLHTAHRISTSHSSFEKLKKYLEECGYVEAWYNSNPSMGYHLNERKIEAELGEDELDHNIQRLGYWPKYNQKSAISEADWQALKVNALPVLKGPLYVGIKYGNDGANVAMSIAVRTLSGKTFVEAIDCQSVRNGNQWIINFLKKANVEKVVIDGAGSQNILAEEMKDFKLKEPILPKVSEIITANSLWEQGIFQKGICHCDQPSLTQVVTNSEKRNIGSNGGFGYKSQFEDMDISLMDSALLAHWVCSINKPKKKQQIRY